MIELLYILKKKKIINIYNYNIFKILKLCFISNNNGIFFDIYYIYE